MKRRLIITFLIFLIFLGIAVSGYKMQAKTFNSPHEVYLDANIIGARVINSRSVYVNQPINLTTIIDNPTTWTLKNISFEIKLDTEINIISIENNSNVKTYVEEGEEEILVKVNISLIQMKSRGSQWMIIAFKEKGSYSIGESVITFVKQKGELIESGRITIPTITINVLEQEKPYPEEGSRDATIAILLFTVIIPVIVISTAHKIAWKE